MIPLDPTSGNNHRYRGSLSSLENSPDRVWVTADCHWTLPDWWKYLGGKDDGSTSFAAVQPPPHFDGLVFSFADNHVEWLVREYNESADAYIFDALWDYIGNDQVFGSN